MERIRHFPISFLAVCLGLIGFTLAWQKAEHLLQLPLSLWKPLGWFTLLVIAVVLGLYLLKLIRFPQEVAAEFRHPIKLNFFPILAKLFLIGSLVLLAVRPALAQQLWWVGVALQLFFSLWIMSAWIRHDKYEVHHLNPSWFIPVVGNVIIPIAGVRFFSPELSWFFFSVGLFWWLVLMAIVMNRIIFHQPMAQKLIPTLFILFAPPVIGFISLTKLLGGMNPAANMLYHFGLFVFLLVLFQLPSFLRLKFNLPWWAYSFPLDALAIGTFLMAELTGLAFFHWLSWGIFVVLNLMIALLIALTLRAVGKRDLCVSEE